MKRVLIILALTLTICGLSAQERYLIIGEKTGVSFGSYAADDILISYTLGLSAGIAGRSRNFPLAYIIEPTVEYAPIYEDIYPDNLNILKYRERFDYFRFTLPFMFFAYMFEFGGGRYISLLSNISSKAEYIDEHKEKIKRTIGLNPLDYRKPFDAGWNFRIGFKYESSFCNLRISSWNG